MIVLRKRKRRGILLVFITNIMMVDFVHCVVATTERPTFTTAEKTTRNYTVKICSRQCEFNMEINSKPDSEKKSNPTCNGQDDIICRELIVNMSLDRDGSAITAHFKYSEYNVWLFVVLSAGPVLVLSLIVLIIVIIVICCRNKRRQKREEQVLLLSGQEDDVPLSPMSPPPAYNQLPQVGVSSTSKRGGQAPKTPPKRPQYPLPPEDSDRPLSGFSTRSDPPHQSLLPPCACGTGGGSFPAQQHDHDWFPDEAELAEAIATTLGRLRAKPTTLNINMYRSRRMSRSVPDLFTPQSKGFTMPKRGKNVCAEEDEEGDHLHDIEMTAPKQLTRGRQPPQKPVKKTSFSRNEVTDTAKVGKRRPISSELFPRQYIRDTSLHIRADDTFQFDCVNGTSGNDVIEVSSTTRGSVESAGYISMNTQRAFARDHAGSPARNPPLPEVPPPKCGITGGARVYENLPDENSSSSSSGYIYPPPPHVLFQERMPIPMPTGAFSYTNALLPPSGHVNASSKVDDDRSTRLSHESSTTVRIYKSGTLRKE